MLPVRRPWKGRAQTRGRLPTLGPQGTTKDQFEDARLMFSTAFLRIPSTRPR